MRPQPPSTACAPLASIHATAVLIGEAGVLIRGASGSGKSSLALALIAACRASGRFAVLVGDDRIRLARSSGRLIARPHPSLAGLIEHRGQGILPVDHESAALIRYVVDLVPGDRSRDIPPRMPAVEDASVAIDGISVPRLAIEAGTPAEEGARRVLAFLHG